jgi:hypothetical protein
MDICPEGMRAVTSLPQPARPADRRDDTNATVCRLIGAVAAPISRRGSSPFGSPSPGERFP